jgi:hypothetical protein
MMKVGRLSGGDQAGGAGRFGGPDDRSEVSGILDLMSHNDQGMTVSRLKEVFHSRLVACTDQGQHRLGRSAVLQGVQDLGGSLIQHRSGTLQPVQEIPALFGSNQGGAVDHPFQFGAGGQGFPAQMDPLGEKNRLAGPFQAITPEKPYPSHESVSFSQHAGNDSSKYLFF